MKYAIYTLIMIFFIIYTLFPLPNCDIHLDCDNIAHIIISKIDVVTDENGSRRDLYTLNILLRQSKINLKREIYQCGEDVANIWAGDEIIYRHDLRAIPKREKFLVPGSFSFGHDSVFLVRATEDEAFALARAICADKTDPELRP